FKGKSGETEALRDVTLRIREGESVTIVGPSGCGKSTLLSLVAGLEDPTTGWVEMDGNRVHGPGADRIVVFQDAALFPWLDVTGNVEFGLRVARVPRRDRKERVARHLATVQLEKFAHARVHELSGGMKQRVALARALVLRPRVLLMDEPFAALDVQIREEMQSVVQDLWQRSGATTLFVTHDVREAAVLGNSTRLVRAIAATLRRLAVGFLMSLVLGALLAFFMVRFATFGKGIQPYILGFQTFPSIAWVPLAIIWFGLSETTLLFVTI